MGNSSGLQSMDQERAAAAWKYVGGRCSSEYANLAKGAPALVMANGLMQTLAFYKQKGKEAERLGRHIMTWVGKCLGMDPGMDPDFREMMAALAGADATTYMRATEEAMEILKWIRHFASAVSQ